MFEMRSDKLTSRDTAFPSTSKSLARRMGTLSSPSREKETSSALLEKSTASHWKLPVIVRVVFSRPRRREGMEVYGQPAIENSKALVIGR